MKTTIYRTGAMSIASHDDDTLKYWAEFDARCPDGHVYRSNVLFAAPDLYGGHYWLCRRAYLRCKPLIFNEITVESDNVRVYRVNDYDRVGEHHGSPTRSQISNIESYWNNGITLTQWMKTVGKDPNGRWEILLPLSEVISSRIIPHDEIEELYVKNGTEELIPDLNRVVLKKIGKHMLAFFKILLHLAYFGVVGLTEYLVFNWLFPLTGMGVTVVATGILFLIFILLYFVIFWGWRPEGEGFFDALFDIGDMFD